MDYTIILTVILLIIAVWYGWRYYGLRRRLNDYAKAVREQPGKSSPDTKELENLASAITFLTSTFNLQHATLESERSRLATVLEQITDGVLIADAQGLIQFANPAAGRLFQFDHPLHHSIAEVVRNHQLVEA